MDNPEIPAHHRQAWLETSLELARAARQLNEANERYHNAIVARIALRELIRKEQS